MTNDNRKVAAALEMDEADAALKAVRLPLDAGLYNDALSRLYYAVYYDAMTALLLTEGVEPRLHRAMATLLARTSSCPARSRPPTSSWLLD